VALVQRAEGNGAGAELIVLTPGPASDRPRADDPGYGHLVAVAALRPTHPRWTGTALVVAASPTDGREQLLPQRVWRGRVVVGARACRGPAPRVRSTEGTRRGVGEPQSEGQPR
jgi:hypothetical protein